MFLILSAAFAGMSSSALTGTLTAPVDEIRQAREDLKVATLDGGDLGRITVFCKAGERDKLDCRVESSKKIGFEIGPIGTPKDGSIQFSYTAGDAKGRISLEPQPTP